VSLERVFCELILRSPYSSISKPTTLFEVLAH
jgi:hypothetical protein